MCLRLLHIADLHLGAGLGSLTPEASQHIRDLRFEALKKAVILAKDKDCSLILIAGDLFDRPRPSTGLIRRAVNILESAICPVCIIPGNHDGGRESLYVFDRKFFDEADNIQLFVEPRTQVFEESEVAVSGCDPRQGSLRNLKPNTKAKFNVSLVHGAMERPDIQNWEISQKDFNQAPYSYIALGDWHRHSVWPAHSKRSKGAYPGSLVPLAFDEGEGAALLVEIMESKLVIEPQWVGIPIFRHSLRVGKARDEAEVVYDVSRQLRKQSQDYRLVDLNIAIEAAYPPNRNQLRRDLLARLADDFSDFLGGRIRITIQHLKEEIPPETTLAGQIYRMAQQLDTQTSSEEDNQKDFGEQREDTIDGDTFRRLSEELLDLPLENDDVLRELYIDEHLLKVARQRGWSENFIIDNSESIDQEAFELLTALLRGRKLVVADNKVDLE